MTSSEAPSYNKKSPTVKRILREAAELASSPSPDYYAAPLESNIFEWHFTLRGPPDTPYANGIYHGKITLPPTYPMRPPSFRFLSPSGRFEINREICLSISEHHEDTWQPAWGIRTAVVALRGFMETEAGGQLGGLECGEEQRKTMATESRDWTCDTCGKRSVDILKESEEAAKELNMDGRVEDEVPKELKFKVKQENGETVAQTNSAETLAPTIPQSLQTSFEAGAQSSANTGTPTTSQPPVHILVPQPPAMPPNFDQNFAPRPHQQPDTSEDNFWLDRLIVVLVGFFIAVVLQKFMGLPRVF
ncbi:ubiquitin-conjugating enzyme/RWD-like protein [Pyronema domesticum]|uniref:Similar to Ubiquitin-conjugating enzyme E2 J1 acc. no. Q9JJZ4 n=1 Tax=Pyronema omphalodes (strain CBS 100304) TaxID=1076935 RepID=U4LGE9_PYROM|nr:ubiquitin-conjugating enzyme/RWD-like protein [Pyronema domesticum]CCX31184.1 Similar to Ubiquitin-conjugating enzyme E2 J1; acc. no. Q9JJZ4 [Pyronema omphalodes CBS 100304]